MKSRLFSRLVLLVAVTIAAASLISSGVNYRILLPPAPPPAQASLPRSPASYVGVFEQGVLPSYRPVTEFARAAGKQPNLVGYYSGWSQPFAKSFAERAHAHGAVPFVQIDPTDALVSQIATGKYDLYLRTYADSVRDFGHAVVIGFGHEMNAPRYPWGYGHVQPSVFKAAWRHIVTVFHGRGADNVTWLWTVNQDAPGTGPVRLWWPGARYVTWVGIDGYYFQPSDTFATVFGPTISHVRILTDKPILLSETAVAPGPRQFGKIGNLFDGMRRFNTLGLVWFDIAQDDGILHQNWRIEGNPSASAAFSFGVAALTLARPSG
ncbi:MAG TPA: glycosyl hydrolase [Streptosporangiaceae bacterium]